MILIYEKSFFLFVFKLQSKIAYIIKVKLQKVLDENLENKTLITYLLTHKYRTCAFIAIGVINKKVEGLGAVPCPK